MQVNDKVIVITGAASGIGRALAKRFAKEGAKAIALADIQKEPLNELAAEINGLAIAIPCNVSQESDIQQLVARSEAELGPIDIFCSNAGVARWGDEQTPDAEWTLNWDVHVMAHVYAARATAAKMAARGGYMIITSSAAGLLTHISSASYATTKHAAIGLAEFLAIKYGDQGLRVSVLCPQAVRTAMTAGREDDVASVDGMMEPELLADCVIETMAKEKFLILPHPEVLEYMRRKTSDYDRWLKGMRRLRKQYEMQSQS